MMKRTACHSCLVLLCAMMVPALFTQALAKRGPEQKGANASYIGADACQACHDDSYATFAESPHKKLLENKAAAQRGCEACHGPGAAHANSNGDTSRIFSFAAAKPLLVRTRCGACHQAENNENHLRKQLSCLGCHSAHHYSQKEFLLTKPAQ